MSQELNTEKIFALNGHSSILLKKLIDSKSSHQKMFIRINLLAIVFLNTVLTSAKEDSFVKELTLTNFDQVVDGKKFAFVFFYAPWHEQCLRLLERYEEVGDTFSSREDVVIAKVNAYEEIKLATRYWVDEYPAFRYFIKGSITEETYNNGNLPADMIRFIRSKSVLHLNTDIFQTPVIDLSSSNFERIVKDRARSIMVLYYNGNCELCKTLQNTIHDVGVTFRNEPKCLIGRLDCDAEPQICVQQTIPHYPTFKVYSQHNKDGIIYEPGTYQESYSETNITSFMNALCGTQRRLKGRLNEKAGLLDDFNEIAVQFMKDHKRREEILREAKIKALKHKFQTEAHFYMSVMTRVMGYGAGIISEEIDRLERLIAGPLHPNKADEFEKRKNILKQFQVLHFERDEL